jgi:hypothetical protein
MDSLGGRAYLKELNPDDLGANGYLRICFGLGCHLHLKPQWLALMRTILENERVSAGCR